MKRKRPEHEFQKEVKDYLTAFGRRDLCWTAIPNGELRHPIVAKRLKDEGVRPGVSDLVFVLDYGQSAWLELKAPKGRLSDEQIGWGKKVLDKGHFWACARNMDEAIAVFKAWDILQPIYARERA